MFSLGGETPREADLEEIQPLKNLACPGPLPAPPDPSPPALLSSLHLILKDFRKLCEPGRWGAARPKGGENDFKSHRPRRCSPAESQNRVVYVERSEG